MIKWYIRIFILLIVSGLCLHADIVQVAKNDIGVKEGSGRAEEIASKSGLQSSIGRKNAWCAAGVSDWIVNAGYRINRTASVNSLRAELRQAGWQRVSAPQPGAIAFFNWSHVGVVKDVITTKGRRLVVTIEPNTSNQVRELIHYPNKIKEYYIPPQKT
jgi:hypothetical protein